MTIKILPIVLLSLFYNYALSQSSNLTSSPYSLFGLGNQNLNNSGITNSLGKAGIALTSENELNGLNPASLGAIKLNSFFFDIGLNATYNSFGDKSSSARMPTFGVSNISIGFAISDKSGFSLSLIPFTEVGYVFQGLVEPIEGSVETYTSNIIGSGGINNLNINYGRKISKKLNIGISAQYLFGSIKQDEVAIIGQDFLIINDKTFYNGFTTKVGIQYQIVPKFNVSSVLQFSSNLKATKDRFVQKIVNELTTTLEDSENIGVNNFNIPTEITIGIKYDFNKNNYFVADFKRSFWNSIDQKDNIGSFVDANSYGFGFERSTKANPLRKSPFRYRIGYNFDDGNLMVLNKKIATNTITAGIGIPLGTTKKSYLNISYAYGSKGFVSNILVKEYYHTITFNFDFADNWFIKRKYD